MRYNNAGSQVEEHFEEAIRKLGKGTSTMFEEDKE